MKELIKKILREIKECPKGMYFCDDDKICKPDSQKMGSIGTTYELEEQEEMEGSEEIDINIIKESPHRSGTLVLERDDFYEPAVFSIFHEKEGETSTLVSELNQDFFNEQMAITVFEYILTRE